MEERVNKAGVAAVVDSRPVGPTSDILEEEEEEEVWHTDSMSTHHHHSSNSSSSSVVAEVDITLWEEDLVVEALLHRVAVA